MWLLVLVATLTARLEGDKRGRETVSALQREGDWGSLAWERVVLKLGRTVEVEQVDGVEGWALLTVEERRRARRGRWGREEMMIVWGA